MRKPVHIALVRNDPETSPGDTPVRGSNTTLGVETASSTRTGSTGDGKDRESKQGSARWAQGRTSAGGLRHSWRGPAGAPRPGVTQRKVALWWVCWGEPEPRRERQLGPGCRLSMDRRETFQLPPPALRSQQDFQAIESRWTSAAQGPGKDLQVPTSLSWGRAEGRQGAGLAYVNLAQYPCPRWRHDKSAWRRTRL